MSAVLAAQLARSLSTPKGSVVLRARDYGAVPDGGLIPAIMMTSGSAVLAVPRGWAFTTADVGKIIMVEGAGPSGQQMKTTIIGVTNGSTVTLGAAASTTVAASRAVYGSDQTNNLQTVMDAAHGSQMTATVLLEAGLYLTSTGIVHRSRVHVRGAGRERTTIANVSGMASLARAVGWHLGTYGPAIGSASAKNETGYPIIDTPAGNALLTFVTAGNAAQFAAGDYVAIEGGTANASQPNTPNEVARVLRVTSSGIIIDAPLLSDYVAGTATPVVRRLNAGVIASTVSGLSQFSGDKAHLTVAASLRDLTIMTMVPGYAVLNVACADSEISRVNLDGGACAVGNPVYRLKIEQVRGSFSSMALEFAYMSHDCSVRDSTFTRVSDFNPANSAGIWVNNGEGAKRIHFERVVLHDVGAPGSAHQSVEMYDGSTWIGGSVTAGRGTEAFWIGGGAPSTVELATVNGGNAAVLIGGTANLVQHCRSTGTPLGAYAIRVAPTATDTQVRANTLGVSGARTTADAVYDEGVNSRIADSQTYYSKAPLTVATVATISGTSEVSAGGVTWVAGAVSAGHSFQIRVLSTFAGTAGTKTVRVKIGATVAAEKTFAAVTVGQVLLEATATIVDPAALRWLVTARFTGPDGTVSVVMGEVAGAATSTAISVAAQLGNASDSGQFVYREIAPLHLAGTLR